MKPPLVDRAKALAHRALRAAGLEVARVRPGADLAALRGELADQRAFRTAAQAEIAALKARVEAQDDALRVQDTLLAASARCAAAAGDGDAPYPSCPWIEGGASFVPGRVRVCPNAHARGGTPGLVPFRDGPLPLDTILARRDLIRRANRAGGFDPCNGCAFRETRRWTPKAHAFDLLCIAHATACNLACSYCHAVPAALHLQSPNAVPRLLPTFAPLIAEGHVAPGARVQWGGGEPTILREFDALFRLFDAHGAISEVYTSGVRVPPVLLDALGRDRAGVMISLDAGTPGTYASIKGRPVFDRVLANAARYAAANPGRTLLKMILSQRNLNEVDAFLDAAAGVGVRIVCYDTMMYRDGVEDRVIEAAARFVEGAARRGLECRVGEVGTVYDPSARVAERVARMHISNSAAGRGV